MKKVKWLRTASIELRDLAFAGRLEEGALLQTGQLVAWFEEAGVPVHPNMYKACRELSARLKGDSSKEMTMTELTRDQIVSALQDGWGTYVERFERLSPEAQAAFLARQGYACLADLLAHVVAWWEEGLQAVPALLDDSTFSSPDYDVDAFNARAVERFRNVDEPAVIQIFETARRAWLDLVACLPDDALRNKRIAGRLHIEVIGHLAEHAIS